MNKIMRYLQKQIDNNKRYSMLIFIMCIVVLCTAMFCIRCVNKARDEYIFDKNIGSMMVIDYKEINEFKVFRDLHEYYYDFIEMSQPEYNGMKIEMHNVMHYKYMDIILSAGDAYAVEFYNGNSIEYAAKIYTTDGESFRRQKLSDNAVSAGYDSIVIKPLSGNQFGVAYVDFYDDEDGEISLSDVEDNHKNVLYNGKGEQRPYEVTALQAAYVENSDLDITLELLNFHNISITVKNIKNDKGQIIGYFDENTNVLPYDFDKALDEQYKYYTINRTNTDVEVEANKLYISYQLEGAEDDSLVQVYLFDRYNYELFESTNVHTYDNLDEFDFIEKIGDEVVFTQNDVIIREPVFIPEGYKFVIDKGQKIDLVNEAYIVSRSPIFANGTENQIIEVTSSDFTGKGMLILQADGRSSMNHMKFSNLDTPVSGAWKLTGAVTLYESDVDIESCIFTDNLCEDALNVVRSDFYIVNSTFSNTYSDAFDSDFCTGQMKYSTFIDTGNDGTDVSTSNVILDNISFIDIGDKAISGGEKSILHAANINVDGAEVGIASKDTSQVTGDNIVVMDAHFGCVLYQKKPEFDGGYIYFDGFELKGDIGIDYLIEKGSELWINGENIVPRSVSKEDLLIEMMKNGEQIK